MLYDVGMSNMPVLGLGGADLDKEAVCGHHYRHPWRPGWIQLGFWTRLHELGHDRFYIVSIICWTTTKLP